MTCLSKACNFILVLLVVTNVLIEVKAFAYVDSQLYLQTRKATNLVICSKTIVENLMQRACIIHF